MKVLRVIKQQGYSHPYLIHNLITESNLLTFKKLKKNIKKTATKEITPMLHTFPILTSIRLHEEMAYGCMLARNIVIHYYQYMSLIIYVCIKKYITI